MGEDFQDEDFSGVVVNGGNEAVMVSGDIKNGDALPTGYRCRIGVGECLADFLKVSPCGFLRNIMPCGKGNGSLGMKLGVFIEAAAGNDAHELLTVVSLATMLRMSSGSDFEWDHAMLVIYAALRREGGPNGGRPRALYHRESGGRPQKAEWRHSRRVIPAKLLLARAPSGES